jgi:CBS domain containing-hemolysin-like protein
MVTFLECLVLIGLVCLSVSLQKTYRHLPAKELRRRSRAGDSYAAALYKAAGYGVSLDMLLWLFVGVSSSVLFIILSHHLAWWGALPVEALVIWFAFAWVPSHRVSFVGSHSAKFTAPILARLLSLTHPLMSRLGQWVGSIRPVTVHTGLFEKEDLVELLEKQAKQPDNRMPSDELRVAKGSLTFADKLVREVMTPKRMIRFVLADEPISPIVMDELHASGFSRFPVIEPKADNAENIVGTLFIKDLLDQPQGGTVRKVMSKEVYYVNEEQNLLQALDAFIKTKHHLFIVVNNFEEIVGVLSMEDVFEQILGRLVIDEFDHYDDLRAVAMQKAKDHRKNLKHPAAVPKQTDKAEQKTDEPPQEVVK